MVLHSSRKLRRTKPISLALGLLLLVGFIVFIYSVPGVPSAPKRLQDLQRSAAHALSPPSLPFRKTSGGSRSGRSGRSGGGGRGVDVASDTPPVVHYLMNNLTTTVDPIANQETVLILTPLARFYQGYWDNLYALSYPHRLISLGFIIPKGKEGNAADIALQARIQQSQRGPRNLRFASITVLRQDIESTLTSQTEAERHKLENQKSRRTAMAKARNNLLFTTMGPTTSWVFWLDSDIVETPASLIQDLAAHDKPIITPNCYQRYYDQEKKSMQTRPYDYNNWIDSATAQELGKKMGRDDILLEGYASMATYRSLMAYMAGRDGNWDANKLVELDGVGGTALLVKAEVHRDGAMFPPFAFYHLIETEGFAKMANRLGWKSYGLPNYLVGFLLPCI